MPTEPTPEDMARDLEADLGYLDAGVDFANFALFEIAEAACRRAIAAEENLARRNTLATDLLHAERQIESLQAELADLQEECRRRIAAAEEEARFADEARTQLADARKGGEVAVALVRAELAEAVRLMRATYEKDENGDWEKVEAFLAKHKETP